MDYSWIEMLQMFEFSLDDRGSSDFAELVLRLVNHYRWTGKRAQVGAVVLLMARERGCTTRQLYQRMKKSVKNILECDEAALRLWEIVPEKPTSSMLAVAIAEREIRRIERDLQR